MISEKDYNEIYLKGYEDGKNDNNNLKITYAIKPSFTTRKIKELQQKNKQLEDNWNKLKKYISSEWYCFDNESVEFEVAKDILNKMQALEQGSDSK